MRGILRLWRFRLGAASVLVGVLGLFIATMVSANQVTIGPATMEGAETIQPGDWIAGGYKFSMPGTHAAATVSFANATVTFHPKCSDNSLPGPITIPLSSGPYTDPANSSADFPTGDQNSPASYMGALQAPDLCNVAGNHAMKIDSGATFNADVISNNTTNTVAVNFHYRSPNGKGQGNINCADPVQNPEPGINACASSWSATASLVPDPKNTPTIQTAADTSGGQTSFHPGDQVRDKATLAGGLSPTGSVTFKVYAPGDNTCTTALNTYNVTVNDNGDYNSPFFTTTQAGDYHWVASYSGDGNNQAVTGTCLGQGETSSILPFTPQLTTNASAGGALGTTLHDSATLSGGPAGNYSGTIHFKLYATSDCSGSPAFTDDKAITGGNGTYDSATFTPANAGTYRWVASFTSSNPNIADAPATSCSDVAERATINPLTPQLTTNASAGGALGTALHDSATLSGGTAGNYSGTIHFKLYATSDCSGSPAFTDDKAITAGNGTYDSATFTPANAGTYRWVASFSSSNPNVADAPATACSDVAERATINPLTPQLTTNASAGGPLGTTLHDSATLSGGPAGNYSGTIHFTLYSDANCTNSVFTDNKAITGGNGTYDSATFTPANAGTYRWVASFTSSNPNVADAPATSCSDVAERATINSLTPQLTTNASSGGALGTTLHDSATLSGGPAGNYSGTIHFTLYSDANCTISLFSDNKAITGGNGTYDSATFTPILVGTYRWVASFTSNSPNVNDAPPTACNDTNERATIALLTPQLTTNASAGGALGTALHDSATLSGGPAGNYSGTMHFKLYATSDCSGSPAFTDNRAITGGNGTYDSASFAPANVGTYRWVASFTSSDPNVSDAPATACSDVNEQATITPLTPQLTTNASAGGPLGTAIHDSATLSGGPAGNYSGTIHFKLYATSDCSGSPAFTDDKAITGGNGTYDSATFTPANVGTYRWVASFSSSDPNANDAPATACSDVNERATINPLTPQLTTNASAGGPMGTTLHDSATLSGGPAGNYSGTIHFTLYSDANCTNSVFTDDKAITGGNGTYDSATFTPANAGTYRWVASFTSSDPNVADAPATSCSDVNERATINPLTPQLTTNASAGGPIGTALHDSATLSGGTAGNYSGTIHFKLYATSDCSGSPAFTDDKAITAGNGTYDSATFTPANAGTYRWVASFTSSNPNVSDAPVTSCSDNAERATINPLTPQLTTNASAGGPLGTTLHDSATLSGGTAGNYSGTIHFKLYATSDCSGSPAFTDDKAITDGNGTYDSATFTPANAGTYRWVASFSSSDPNVADAPATSCSDVAERATINPLTPQLTTNASAGGPLGTTLHDSATLSGGTAGNYSGTIHFKLYATSDCSGSPAFTDDKAIAGGNGTYDSATFTPANAGTYRWVASFSSSNPNVADAPATACSDVAERATINPLTPQLTTNASSGGPMGTAIHDSATLSGGPAGTYSGTIHFKLYATSDCSGSPAFTDDKAITGGNGTYSSATFAPANAGTYRWVASFISNSPNVNDAPATACNDIDERASINDITPQLTTNASPGGPLGTAIHDSATLSGGPAGNYSGTIHFTLYSDASCTNSVFTDSKAITGGNGAYDSASFVPANAGTYRWISHFTSTDPNIGDSPDTACNDTNEQATINPPTPQLTTNASSGGPMGTAIHDSATLSGGPAGNYSGTIHFKLYATSDCSGSPAFTDDKAITGGNGTYDSATFTPANAGTYRWVTSFSSSDPNVADAPATSCSDVAERATITPLTPQLTTNASAGGPLGTTLHDSATLSGGTAGNYSGTLHFKLYATSDCSGSPAFTDDKAITGGNGTYDSAASTPANVGTYRWVASFSSSDPNVADAPATSCSDVAERATITPLTPQLTTNASSGGAPGTALHDSATLSGGPAGNYSGTIHFTLYSDANCTNSVSTDNKAITAGNGTYDSAASTPTNAGTYRWVASFTSSDPNVSDAPATACNDTNERATIDPGTIQLTTRASSGGAMGTAIHDTATLSGTYGSQYSGTLHFKLYATSDCSGSPVFTDNNAITGGNGTYDSASFTPTKAGTYRWVASFTSSTAQVPDATEQAPCIDPNEHATLTDGGSSGAGEEGSGSSGSNATSGNGSSLPFTGLQLGGMALAATALLGGGLLLRRRRRA